MIIKALILAVLSWITYQDFKSRLISWWLLPVLALLLILRTAISSPLRFNFIDLALNLIILAIIVGTVCMYVVIREKSIKSLLIKYIGLGDLLLMLVMVLAFTPMQFVVFLIISFITAIIWGLFQIATNDKAYGVPLAGVMSMLLIFFLILENTFIWSIVPNSYPTPFIFEAIK